MGISDILFEAEVAINDQLTSGHYGADDDPIRHAIVDLLAHVNAIRMLPGLDGWPCDGDRHDSHGGNRHGN